MLDDVAGAVRLEGARRPSRSRLAHGAQREAVIDRCVEKIASATELAAHRANERVEKLRDREKR